MDTTQRVHAARRRKNEKNTKLRRKKYEKAVTEDDMMQKLRSILWENTRKPSSSWYLNFKFKISAPNFKDFPDNPNYFYQHTEAGCTYTFKTKIHV